MKNYVLDHAKDKDILLVYEGRNGITERRVHVVTVNEQWIRTYQNGQWLTFLRKNILSCDFVQGPPEGAAATQRAMVSPVCNLFDIKSGPGGKVSATERQISSS